jgi:hypothetical protein
MKTLRGGMIFCMLIVSMVLLAGCPASEQTTKATTVMTTTDPVPTKKPAIYLYPAEPMTVRVTLKYQGRLTCTYPEYQDGWQVVAHPDGTLVNQADGREYSYLFWEGIAGETYDFSRGFVVKGQDTSQFLQEKLAYLGLTPREFNDFIVYWLPQMQDNPYNLITFQGEAYTRLAGLEITPAPDSLLRIFMAYRPLQQPITITEQVLSPGIRKGFTVVEWGGSCVQ